MDKTKNPPCVREGGFCKEKYGRVVLKTYAANGFKPSVKTVFCKLPLHRGAFFYFIIATILSTSTLSVSITISVTGPPVTISIKNVIPLYTL